MQNLQQKALQSGLEKTALLPKQSSKDQQIFHYLTKADDEVVRAQSAKP
jgi:hypothetical protein